MKADVTTHNVVTSAFINVVCSLASEIFLELMIQENFLPHKATLYVGETPEAQHLVSTPCRRGNRCWAKNFINLRLMKFLFSAKTIGFKVRLPKKKRK